MTDQGTTEEEGTEGTEGTENEGTEGTEEQTLEEIKAERDEFKARLDRQRTAKAREARAANRAKGGGKADPKNDDDDSELAAELAAERERSSKLETRLNTEQATRIAAELGFKTPKIGVKALEWDELTDPSDPDEIRAELRTILKESPELKKAARQSADGGEGGATGSGGVKTSFNDIIRRAAGRG